MHAGVAVFEKLYSAGLAEFIIKSDFSRAFWTLDALDPVLENNAAITLEIIWSDLAAARRAF